MASIASGPMIRQLKMSSLRALEREATLAGFLLCDPCPMDLGSGHLQQLRNVARSSSSEVGLNLFGVRLAVLARVKPSDENFVCRLIASFSEPVYLRYA